MKLITEEMVEHTWQEARTWTRAQRTEAVSGLSYKQPWLQDFLANATSELSSRLSEELWLATHVIWQLFERVGGPLPEIQPPLIEQALHSNHAVLESLREGDLPTLTQPRTLSQVIPQPFVLQRVLTLVFPELRGDHRVDIGQDQRGYLFFVLKTVIDVFCAQTELGELLKASDRRVRSSPSSDPTPTQPQGWQELLQTPDRVLELLADENLRYSTDARLQRLWLQSVELTGHLRLHEMAGTLCQLLDGPEESLDLTLPVALGQLGGASFEYLTTLTRNADAGLRERVRALAALACIAACYPEWGPAIHQELKSTADGMVRSSSAAEKSTLQRWAASLLRGLCDHVTGALPPSFHDDAPLPLPRGFQDGHFVPASLLLRLALEHHGASSPFGELH